MSVANNAVVKPAGGRTRPLVFTVRLSVASSSPVSVHYATADASAISPTNYTAASGTTVFPAGQVSETISVTIIGNDLVQGTKTFHINLTHPVGGTLGTASAIGYIFDNNQKLVHAPTSTAPLSDVVIDGGFAYATNPSLNEVEVVDLSALTLAKAIPVGSHPTGIAASPDGKTLYVANTGGTNISVVNVATRKEVKRITTPTGFSSDTPSSLATTNTGRLIFSTTFNGSGGGGNVWDLTLATQTFKNIETSTTEATTVRASGDHSRVVIVEGDDSAGQVQMFDAATDAITATTDLNSFVSLAAVDMHGDETVVDGTFVLDGSLNRQGTIGGQGGGTALASTGISGYRVDSRAFTTGKPTIDVLNVPRFLETRQVPLLDTIARIGEVHVAISADNTTIVLLTDNGVLVWRR